MPAPAETIASAIAIARAADDKQADDLVLIDVSELLALVDCFLIVTARNDRHLKAVADAIEETMCDRGAKPIRREGPVESGWYLLDYGDVVCHLFTEEQRAYYTLERLWADVPHLDPLTGERLDEERAVAGG